MTILDAKVTQADLLESANYDTMKCYVIFLLKGISQAKELISFKDHRVCVSVVGYVRPCSLRVRLSVKPASELTLSLRLQCFTSAVAMAFGA